MKFLPYGRQYIDDSDIAAVVEVLKGDWLTQGPVIEDFERRFASYCGAEYAIAVSSGTAALHLAVKALGLQRGDRVITSPMSFVATSNCILYNEGLPLFCDIEFVTRNISVSSLKDIINKHRENKIRGIIPVHYGGYPCHMEEIRELASKNGLWILEDACHAVGSKYKGHMIGSCTFSDACVFSFHPVKTITCGEGGIITTNSKSLYEKVKSLRTHGVKRDTEKIKIQPWYYEIEDLGFNYRITDIQAALGRSQLSKLDMFVEKRRKLVERYVSLLRNMEYIYVSEIYSKSNISWHLFTVNIDFSALKTERGTFIRLLKNRNIGTQVHYIPIYRHPLYKRLGFKDCYLENTEKYYGTTLTLPLFPAMEIKDVDRVVSTLKEVIYSLEGKKS